MRIMINDDKWIKVKIKELTQGQFFKYGGSVHLCLKNNDNRVDSVIINGKEWKINNFTLDLLFKEVDILEIDEKSLIVFKHKLQV